MVTLKGRDLLHGAVLSFGLPPQGLGLFVAESERHGHRQMIPRGITRNQASRPMWVGPTGGSGWPHRPLKLEKWPISELVFITQSLNISKKYSELQGADDGNRTRMTSLEE